jgi:predicted RecA/RadA family phage recombinase
MGTTYVQQGDVLTLTAPTGGVTAGVPLLIGSLLVIPRTTAAQTVAFDADVVGVHAYTKTASQAWSEGQNIYWNTSTAQFDSDPTTGPLVGVAVAAVAGGAGDTTGTVRLTTNAPTGGGLFTVRKRFTIAQVNAGATILAALAAVKYRMIDCVAIAIGGNATTGTTVDILGTLTTSSRKLVAYATAQLTRSAVVHSGETGGAVLADGASFTANDANTAVTIGKTGTDYTVATDIDVILTYAMDPA